MTTGILRLGQTGAAGNDVGLAPPGILDDIVGGVPVPGAPIIFYNFNTDDGYFTPIFTDPTWATITFDANGRPTIAMLGPRSDVRNFVLCGVQAKFNVFFDQNCEAQIRWKFDQVIAGASGSANTNVGIGAFIQEATTGANVGMLVSMGLHSALVNTHCMIGEWMPGHYFGGADPGFQANVNSAKTFTEYQMRVSFGVDGTLRLAALTFEYYDHLAPAWVPIAPANPYYVGMNITNGLSVYLGLLPYTREVISARLVEFEITKGYGCMSSSGGSPE